MNLDLDPTQTLLRDTVREFLADTLPLDRVRECERDQCWDAKLWEDVVRQGWLGLPFPEAQGGGGAGLVEAGLLLEAFSRRAAVVPLAETLVCGLAAPGSGEPGESLRAGLLAGQAVPVPATILTSRQL